MCTFAYDVVPNPDFFGREAFPTFVGGIYGAGFRQHPDTVAAVFDEILLNQYIFGAIDINAVIPHIPERIIPDDEVAPPVVFHRQRIAGITAPVVSRHRNAGRLRTINLVVSYQCFVDIAQQLYHFTVDFTISCVRYAIVYFIAYDFKVMDGGGIILHAPCNDGIGVLLGGTLPPIDGMNVVVLNPDMVAGRVDFDRATGRTLGLPQDRAGRLPMAGDPGR